jgi:hypothetical protein
MTIGIAAALEYFEWVAQHLQLDYSLVSLRRSKQNCLSVSRSPGAFRRAQYVGPIESLVPDIGESRVGIFDWAEQSSRRPIRMLPHLKRCWTA